MTSATYDAANRITTRGGTTFTHDLNGNLTGDGFTSYTWNARNQLTGLSGGTSASFAYDGRSRRRSKTTFGVTTGFLYDDANVVQELSGTTPIANLLTGLDIDETFTRTDAGGTTTLLVDALRSTLALADATGAVQTQYTFEPFGATTASGAASANAFQFTGRENDGTGLYFYRARYYSSQLQRFIAEDPLGFDGGDVNLYAYVGNEPTLWRDPLGLFLLKTPPGSPCYVPPSGRKDEPRKPPLSWYFTCSPFVVPDLIPLLPSFPWPTGPKPPSGPKPPGYDPADPGWRPGYPEGPNPKPPRWFDPDGGEWRYHPPDRWHPNPHWDHNPWDQWNSPWKNTPIVVTNEDHRILNEPALRVAA